ncbi:hypothetical protein Q4488_09025 [Amphritea sp. 1_MG-2023]|uniref:hypothetical protein n=1 Tax=Amphritea sp. 1_MG-2023 TaxID=3062670 RepID=UPI0026E47815|nr:hypothetical protein [Amphritea sp. 1_MG-2023]MDO6563523.1 hypothetical protein [Amphritea sp. 1_MG-2023]
MGVSHNIKLTKRTVNKVIHLGVVGFELQSKTAIELFFKQHQAAYALVAAEQADVLMFNMESPAIQAFIDEYQGERPLIAVTATAAEFQGGVTLRKPLQGKQVMQAIKQVMDQFDRRIDLQPSIQRVSREAASAFQAYQQRLASERQALADYQANGRSRCQHLPSTPTTDRSVNPAALKEDRLTVAPMPASVLDGSVKETRLEANVEAATIALAASKLAPRGPQKSEKKPADIQPKLTYQMVYECCGNAPDINLYEADQRRRIFFKKEATLLAILLDSITEGRARQLPLELTGLPGLLAYLPAEQQFCFDFSEELLIPLALTRFGYQELGLNVRPDLAVGSTEGNANLTTMNSDELIWQLALWTSKGRLDRMIDPQQPYQLTKTLDFDRLLSIPHISTMANLWTRHRLSAIEVLDVLKIHQRYVFAFMTAAFCLQAFE